jgi:hypothetical protein
MLADGTACFAPPGELVVVDGWERVLCHLCGRLALLGRRICAGTIRSENGASNTLIQSVL